MGAFFEWVVSDQGLKTIGVLLTAVWGLVKGKGALDHRRANRSSRLRELADELYKVVEKLDQAGKFKTAIDKGMAKWSEFYRELRDAMRAEGLGETTVDEEQWLTNLVHRWAWLEKKVNGTTKRFPTPPSGVPIVKQGP